MEKYAIPNKLPSKQVSILAQRKGRINKLKQTFQKSKKYLNKKKTAPEVFRKPEYFISEYRKAERDDTRIKRELMRNGLSRSYQKDGALVIVIRHRGTHIASRQCIDLLQKLRLSRIHQAVFMRLTDENKAFLSLVEPYVIYGYPSTTSVRELIFKYGFINFEGKKSNMSSNTKIETVFGKEGIICVEDIIHEVFTLGPNFDRVTKALYPFYLPNPRDGWIGQKGLKAQKGGISGCRGNEINEVLKTIL